MDWKEISTQMLKYPNVVGLSESVQWKLKNGIRTDIDCIRVYVDQKKPFKALSADERIPAKLDMLATDVVAIGKLQALNVMPMMKALEIARTSKIRPVIAGISTGHPTVTAGTNAQPCIDDPAGYGWLSNWHVWKGFKGFINDRVLQPGTYDNGKVPDDEYAILRYAIDIKKEGEGINEIDAAFASVINRPDWTNLIARRTVEQTFVCQGEAMIKQNDYGFFTGRTTPYGEGFCTDDNAMLRIDYGQFPASYNALFQKQTLWEYQPNIQGGNSGSGAYLFGDLFGGLAFAGSTQVAVVCRWELIKDIWYKLYRNEIKVSTGEAPPPPPPTWALKYEDIDTRLYKRSGQ